MANELVPNNDEYQLDAAKTDLLKSFLNHHATKKRTAEAYLRDFIDFQRFLNAPTLQVAMDMLLSRTHGEANQLVTAYQSAMARRNLAPNTMNRRLSALRSLTKMARSFGHINWSLEVSNLPSEPYRDTAGPGKDGFFDMLDAATERLNHKTARDAAILRLLFDLALRRQEVADIDLKDLNLKAGWVMILGKKRFEQQKMTLPEATKQALATWIAFRGEADGPLFTSFDTSGKSANGSRLDGSSIYRIVRKYGEAAGVEKEKSHPHGLRHAAITAALDEVKDLRKVQRFSRHKDVRTLSVYDDNRSDFAGEVSETISKRPEDDNAEESD